LPIHHTTFMALRFVLRPFTLRIPSARSKFFWVRKFWSFLTLSTKKWVNPNNIITNAQEPKLPTVEHVKPLSAWNCWVFFFGRAFREISCKKYIYLYIKSMRGAHFTILPASPCAADFYENWHTIRSTHRRHYECQIFNQSVQRLQSSDTPKIVLSHWLAASPLQRCTHCRATVILSILRIAEALSQNSTSPVPGLSC